MNVPTVEDDKNRIKRYLLGQLAEAEEEQIELRLLSDRAFGEEFDIVVDEIATAYVSGQLKGEEKKQVEQHFLRSPERRRQAQFICALLSEIGEDGTPSPVPAPKASSDISSGLFQFLAFRPAISLAVLLIVAGLVFWVISLNSRPTYVAFELGMTSARRDVGTETKRVSLAPGTDGLRIKLRLPMPTAPQYRASLRGEMVSLPELAIEAQDAGSISVMVPADELSRGTYVIELTEIKNGIETPLRGAYVFTVD